MSNGGPRRAPVVLIVLDGWGYRRGRTGNAIRLASAPTWERLWRRAPRTLLQDSGRAVGLPDGQMGNSEVGHLNLGAGRVVPQDIVRISDSVASGAFFELPPFVALGGDLEASGGTLHLIGLIGPGGVHALDRHLFALIELGWRRRLPRTVIHCILDGRDTPPTSAGDYLAELLRVAAGRAEAATVVGRYYAMDRDRRWERTRLAYDALVHGVGERIADPLSGIAQAYARGETDEFVRPLVIAGADGGPAAPLRPGDGVICFNFRADRMRQLVRALTESDFTGFDRGARPAVRLVTMTQYDETFTLPVAFGPHPPGRIIADVLSERGLSTFRTAETEKYAHVTYFFNGGVEVPYRGEERLLVDSQKVATYDLKPEMSAPGVTDVLCRAIEGRNHDFILCNYANGDMVGHTGVLSAAVAAVSTVDSCLGRVLATADRAGATVLITADHGNCETMLDPKTGGPHTAHTTNPVPFVIVDGERDWKLRPGGSLADVGPTALGLLGVEPAEPMTGRDLRVLE